MIGIDRSFAAAMLIGYHARAGTENAIMEHTITGFVHSLKINGMPAGEIAMSAAVAGCFDVPVVCVSSDAAGCAEAKALLPNVETAAVKEGLGRYMGKVLHPSETAPMIQEAARRGVEKASSLDPWLPETPATVTIEVNRSEEADIAAKLVGVRRLDAYTLECTADTWAEVHQMAWMVFGHASMGKNAY